jgi:sodium/bile acid cotransporter 7
MVLSLLSRFGIDTFLLGLMGMVALAWIVPDMGKSGGHLHMELVSGYGVALAFGLYGLTLPPERMKAGFLNWRLHALVQGATYVLFPVAMWGLAALARPVADPAVLLGFFFLAALPSTVSSSVAMTSIAKGNVAGAIFNATLSSLIGVVVTPLWVNAFLAASGAGLDLAHVLGRVTLLVVVPIIAGQLLRPYVHGWVDRNVTWIKWVDRVTILLIVFNSFADSVAEGVWSHHGLQLPLWVAAASLALFFVVFGLLSVLCRLLGFSREDRIAGVFCGTKKSLATGVPMARIMFGGDPALGLIIVPIVLYHFIQLVVASFIARRYQADA